MMYSRPEDAETVVLMILTKYDTVVFPTWYYDSKGAFSVKLAYKLVI